KDFSTQVSNLSDAGCDVIYLPIYYTEAGLIAKAAAAKGYNVPIFGNDGLDGVSSQITAADNITAKITYLTPYDPASTDEKVVAFTAKYQEKYKEAPNQFAADGYDAVMILFNAMKVAGVNDVTMSAADMSAKVKDVLTSSSFSYSGLTGSGMTWDKTGSCAKEPVIVSVNK
ncbi:MAG: ABC transporter substrate-binding protein, partial [Clostridia bacterium]|nr:ABC transporter substrate-binding protein [Clostridia bacterium]